MNHADHKLCKRRNTTLSSIMVRSALLVVFLQALPLGALATTQSLDVTSNNLQIGMLTSLSKNSNVAEPASDKNAASLVGVRVADDTTTLERQPGQVSISDTGQASVLTSTLNGDIGVGDRIAVTSIAGVGAKATASSWTVGVAQTAFTKVSAGAVTSELTDSSGAKRQVAIGRIPVLVQVSYFNKAATTQPAKDQVPARLQTAADSLAGKHASVLAIILSFIVLILVLVIAGVIISSAVRGGMLAIGRQPLAKRAITRQTIKSASLSLAILFVGVAAAFILLRVF